MSKNSTIRCQSLGRTWEALAISRFARNYWKQRAAANGELRLAEEGLGSVLVIVPLGADCEALERDLRFLLSGIDPKTGELSLNGSSASPVSGFPGWEVLPFDVLSPAAEVSAKRIQTLSAQLLGKAEVVLVAADALMQKIIPRNILSEAVLRLRVGLEIPREEVLRLFHLGGYSRSTVVEEVGEFAVRGSLIDFFPPGSLDPIRAEFFGDQIESLRFFESTTQRSTAKTDAIDVLPVRELLWLPKNGTKSENTLPEMVVHRIKARASELALPQSEAKEIEEAICLSAKWPGIEHILPLVCDNLEGLWQYLGDGAPVVVVDEVSVAGICESYQEVINERAKKATTDGRIFPSPESAYFSLESIEKLISDNSCLFLDRLGIIDLSDDLSPVARLDNLPVLEKYAPELGLESVSLNTSLITSLKAARQKELPFSPLADEIKKSLKQGYGVCVVVFHRQRSKRIIDLLAPYEIAVKEFSGSFAEWLVLLSENGTTPSVSVMSGNIESGFRLSDQRAFVIADRELFPEISTRQTVSNIKQVRRYSETVSQLKENDYVVHIDYGIGLYRGLTQKVIENKIGDFLSLEYAEGAKLLLPVENICRVQKYRGIEGIEPSLSRLGGRSWEISKRKVNENVAELAGKLLELMAERAVTEGYSFPEIDSEDLEFATSFPYEETADQSTTIEAVLADMSRTTPMDRLVCGDVGYGKTEVAIRAAFKAASSGKQVALLVPTTILADQHYSTFTERFAQTAVSVGCVSRFYSAIENKRTLEALANGTLDIIIGTHRLLQRDVGFKDLGLIIIDEEHRFGVAHKEKLKSFRASVDVLTLTATPIPRTLHMSLVGIRDLSLIETPPTNRQVIRTYIAPLELSVIREAVIREIGRGGQVFYVNNRVRNIELVAEELKELVPEARVVVGHGQMKERELEDVIHRFIEKEYDVLVCTTIVESGIDIPNANTMIIRDADKFGLAELYQLRGRVGRSSRRAYAYLLVSDPKNLRTEARKRLQVLQSLDDLGVGFRLALQDMEIRGAGNLLGKNQSGNISSIGYELYSQILKRAVEQLQKKQARNTDVSLNEVPDVDPEVRIGFPAHIPPDYIPDVAERLLLYQRLINLRDNSHGLEFAEELVDRFGRFPESVQQLIELMVFRSVLRRVGITKASYRDELLSITFHPEVKLDSGRLLNLTQESFDNIRIRPGSTIQCRVQGLKVSSPADITQFLEQILVIAKIV